MASFCLLTGQTPAVYLSLTQVQVDAFIEAASKFRMR